MFGSRLIEQSAEQTGNNRSRNHGQQTTKQEAPEDQTNVVKLVGSNQIGKGCWEKQQEPTGVNGVNNSGPCEYHWCERKTDNGQKRNKKSVPNRFNDRSQIGSGSSMFKVEVHQKDHIVKYGNNE